MVVTRVVIGTQKTCHILAGSAGKHWPEAGHMILAHRLASRPDPFGQNLTQLARTKLDLACFAYYAGRLWKNTTGSENGKLIAGRLLPARNGGHWAHSFPHTS